MPATKPLRQTKKSPERSTSELISSAPGGLDSIDRQIISHLQRDGRRAYGAIAAEGGLSEAGVRRRVQRLKDSGVMQIDIIAEVIAVDDDALVHLLNDSIRSIPGVTEVETFLYLKLSKQTYVWGTK